MTHSWSKVAATAIASDNHASSAHVGKIRQVNRENNFWRLHRHIRHPEEGHHEVMVTFAAFLGVNTEAITSSGSRQKRPRRNQALMNLRQLPPQPHSLFTDGGICPQGVYS